MTTNGYNAPIRAYRFDIESYRADMNALLVVCHTLYHIASVSLQYAAAARRREQDYHKLLEESNEMLHVVQSCRAWQAENEHLWGVVAALDKELRECSEP